MKRRNSHPTGRTSFIKKMGETISIWLTKIRSKITKSWILLVVSLIILIPASFIIWKIFFTQSQGLTEIRTGFVSYYDESGEFHPAKTLWDLLELFLVPVALSVGALLFNRAEKKRELDIQERRRSTDLGIAAQNRREATLQKYLDDIADLLLNKNLHEKSNQVDSPVVKIARVKTVTVIRMLENDIERVNVVFQFLRDSGLGRFILIDAPLQGMKLEGANMSAINFDKAYFQKANLNNASLAMSDLNGADLEGTTFIGADLFNTSFRKADLTQTDFSNTMIMYGDFSEAKLSGANFMNAKFGVGTKFVGAKGANVNFTNAKLSDISSIDFTNAVIQDSNFHGANLLRGNFNNAKLESCDFGEVTTCGEFLSLSSKTTFIGAELFNVHFHKADLTRADLTDASLGDLVSFQDAKITKEQLRAAKIEVNGYITLPNGKCELGKDILARWENSTDTVW